ASRPSARSRRTGAARFAPGGQGARRAGAARRRRARRRPAGRIGSGLLRRRRRARRRVSLLGGDLGWAALLGEERSRSDIDLAPFGGDPQALGASALDLDDALDVGDGFVEVVVDDDVVVFAGVNDLAPGVVEAEADFLVRVRAALAEALFEHFHGRR